jgi:hypothetical protein
MWCLGISIAHPDYKRPSIDTNIYFFETEEEALIKLKDSKILFIADFDTSEDPRISTLTINSLDELIEELFQMVSDPDTFYSEMYMDNQPFYWQISEVKVGEEMFL